MIKIFRLSYYNDQTIDNISSCQIPVGVRRENQVYLKRLKNESSKRDLVARTY